MLRIQLERQDIKYFPSLREYTMMYGLNRAVLDSLNKPITIMHPGPINRGVEITSDVADSEHAIILEQVENGVAIRSEEHTSELQSLMRTSYAVFCLNKKTHKHLKNRK